MEIGARKLKDGRGSGRRVARGRERVRDKRVGKESGWIKVVRQGSGERVWIDRKSERQGS